MVEMDVDMDKLGCTAMFIAEFDNSKLFLLSIKELITEDMLLVNSPGFADATIVDEVLDARLEETPESLKPVDVDSLTLFVFEVGREMSDDMLELTWANGLFENADQVYDVAFPDDEEDSCSLVPESSTAVLSKPVTIDLRVSVFPAKEKLLLYVEFN